ETQRDPDDQPVAARRARRGIHYARALRVGPPHAMPCAPRSSPPIACRAPRARGVAAMTAAARAPAAATERTPRAVHRGVLAVLAARLVRRLVGDDPLAVGLGAALFALHATRSASVMWVVGMTDVLMAVPGIAALSLVVRGLDGRPAVPSWGRGLWAAGLIAL